MGARLGLAVALTAGVALAPVLALAPAFAQQARPQTPAAQPAPAQPATPLPPRAASQKTFQRQDLIAGARRYERLLRREATAPSGPLDKARRDAAQAFQRNDARGAAELYAGLALAQAQDPGIWMRLARSLAAIKPTDDEDASTFIDNALAAAFIAYRRATTRAEEGEALSFIGHVYADRRLWQPAIDTMKLALEVRDTPADRSLLRQAEGGARLPAGGLFGGIRRRVAARLRAILRRHRAGHRLSPPSFRWAAWTSRPSPARRGRSAWKASSTAPATPSRCGRACPRPMARS